MESPLVRTSRTASPGSHMLEALRARIEDVVLRFNRRLPNPSQEGDLVISGVGTYTTLDLLISDDALILFDDDDQFVVEG